MNHLKKILTLITFVFCQTGYTRATTSQNQAPPEPPQVVQQPVLNPHVPEVTPAELEAIYNEAAALFYQLENLVAQNKADEAYRLADALLIEIKKKMGINPVLQGIQEPVMVANVIPEGQTSFANLNYQQKKAVRQAVGRYMGGTYIELLLLYKRVRVLHSAAVVVTRNVDSRGKFLGVDQKYVTTALAEAYRVTIEIVDVKNPTAQPLVAFDSEILDEDFSFESNRDVLVQAMKICQLKMKEDDFLNAVRMSMNTRRGVTQTQPSTHSTFLYDQPNFKVCRELFEVDYSTSSAVKTCSDPTFRKFQFINNYRFDRCLEIYRIDFSISSAATKCMNKIISGEI